VSRRFADIQGITLPNAIPNGPGRAHHTSRQFDAELEAVRTRVLQMGGMVEQQVVKAMGALASGDLQAIENVIADDHRVNAMEVDLDEACSTLIARRQPAAVDLRLIIAVIKTITDLERIGDEAEKIARMAKLIHTAERTHLPRIEVRHVANLALDMLRKALDAFARLDSAAAASLVSQDRLVDDEFRSILRQIITFMMEDPRTISGCLETLFIAKALERVGDHSKNMAEYVIYMVEGRDVRHLRSNETGGA
jgi:phosphate transport system protein